MRISIDIDGVLCETKRPGQTYDQLKVNPRAVEKLKELKAAGHYIILQTARHMKTTNGNVGEILARVGKSTLDWLAKNEIPYDEIYFGKPYAEAYIDDKAFSFTSWDEFDPEYFRDEHVNVVIQLPTDVGDHVEPIFFEKVQGKTVVELAVSSLGVGESYNLFFVIGKEHAQSHNVEQKLKQLFGERCHVLLRESTVTSLLEAFLQAKPYINNFNNLLVTDSLRFIEAPLRQVAKDEGIDAVVNTSVGIEENREVTRNDEFGFVLQVENIPSLISTCFFRRGSDFVYAAENLVRQNIQTVSAALSCNELVKSGKRIRSVNSTNSWLLTTVQEIQQFKKNFKPDSTADA